MSSVTSSTGSSSASTSSGPDARPPPAASSAPAQLLAQPAQRHDVGAAQRGRDELDGRRPRRAGSGSTAQAQQREQRPDGRLLGQRHLVAGDLDRHARREHGAAQHRHRPGGGPHQHRHPRPRHAVDQVGLAQVGRDLRRLLGLRPQDRHRHRAVRQVARRDQVAVPAAAAEAAGDPPRRRQQGRPGPPARPQRAAPVPASRRPPGSSSREVPDAVDVGPAEAVDRLVRVADRHQVAAAPGQQPQQLDLGRVGVLQLVDEDDRPRGPLGVEQLRLAQPEPDDGPDQLRRVVRRGVAQARSPRRTAA